MNYLSILLTTVGIGSTGYLYNENKSLKRKNNILAEDNILLKEELRKARNEVLLYKKKFNYLLNGFREMYKSYLLYGDSLKEHAFSLYTDGIINSIPLFSDNTIKKEINFKLPHSEIQHFTPDMLMVKVTGLTDAYILNKWSIIDSKTKIDLSDFRNLNLLTNYLVKENKLTSKDKNFTENLFNSFKKPFLIDGDIPEIYTFKDIQSDFNHTIDMILNR